MNKSRRGTYIWLLLLGAAVSLIALASAVDPTQVSSQIALLLMAAYAVLASFTLLRMTLPTLKLEMPRIATPAHVTPTARKAVQRARSRNDFAANLTVADLGLIVNEHRSSGDLNRHLAQIVSLDDEAVQPYITVHATPEQANRVALIQFDIFDHSGKHRFSRTCEQWLRDGENQIFCDRQLRMDNDDQAPARAGVWDLRIKVDGDVAAVHSFTVNPSTAERRRQFSQDGEARIDGLAVPDAEESISLEDLLREQRRGSSRNS